MNKGKIMGLIATYHDFPGHGCGMKWADHCPGMLLGKALSKTREQVNPDFIAAELQIPRPEAYKLFWMEGGMHNRFNLLSLAQQKAYVVGVLEDLMETGHVVFPEFELIRRFAS